MKFECNKNFLEWNLHKLSTLLKHTGKFQVAVKFRVVQISKMIN